MVVREIDSLSGFVEAVKSIQKSKEPLPSDGYPYNQITSFFYRGQCNEYAPLPSVFRDNFMYKEDFLYHELIMRCPEQFRGLSHLDTLVLMQHYGLPTRLLDITSNPLVALYFACKDYTEQVEEDAVGHIYVYASSEIAYSDSDRVLMLSCFPIFSLGEKGKMLKIVNGALTEDKIKRNADSTYPAAIERLFHEITKEVPAFKREIVPKDLVTPLIVKPLKANARILKQDGAFIISGLCGDKAEAEAKIQDICIEEVRVVDRRQILYELDLIGINEASLFPEVDKVAGYLKSMCER